MAPRPELRDRELTYICVPLLLQGRSIGALGVDLAFELDRDYEGDLQFFQLVAAMLSQAVAVRRQVDVERRRLVDENAHLRQELKERYDFSNIIGTSGPMRQVSRRLSRSRGRRRPSCCAENPARARS